MTDQNTTRPNIFSTETPAPDVSKHVNYLLGMVLGVEDFDQEFAYLSNRDQWLARDLIGYGTVCGLGVSWDEKQNTLQVEPGVALTPSGKFIKVDATQCADLKKWIEGEHVRKSITHWVDEQLNQTPGVMTAGTETKTIKSTANEGARTLYRMPIYLKLCYRECQTDSVPVAGKACGTVAGDQDALLNPSRIQDDYYLDILFDPDKSPDQTEQDALRHFVAWLCAFKVVDSSNDTWTPEAFAQAIRKAAKALKASPRKTDDIRLLKDFLKEKIADNPFAKTELNVILQAAFHAWATDLRPLLRGGHANCVNPSQEDCVLLAWLDLVFEGDATNGWRIEKVIPHEGIHSSVLHLRMLQEWIVQNSCFPGNTVVAENTFSNLQQPANPGNSNLFSRADHTHGVPKDPIVDHITDTDAHNGHLVGGEVTGTINNTVVSEILNLPVAYPPPAPSQVHAGQVLTLVPASLENTGRKVTTGKSQAKRKKASLKAMETTFQWQAMDLPLHGDVVPPPANRPPNETTWIESLQGKPVDTSGLRPGEYGQVLRFVKGEPRAITDLGKQDRWLATDLPPAPQPSVTLIGDVVPPPAGRPETETTWIESLQGTLVETAGVTDGQVLTFVQGSTDPKTGEVIEKSKWVPRDSIATGQFVKRSLSADYEIAAAGTCYFKLDPSSLACWMENSYNIADVTQDSNRTAGFDIELTFKFTLPIKVPRDTSPCIVKLTPWCASRFDDTSSVHSPLFTVYFTGFISNTPPDPAEPSEVLGFKIGISSLDNITVKEEYVDGRIMVEVSQFASDESNSNPG